MNVTDYFFENSKNLDKHFVLGHKESISFKQLYGEVQTLAKYLHTQIGTGNNIALVAQNSIFFIVSYLGILKSGNVCVPLDYAIEQGNLDFIMHKTKSEHVFISSRNQRNLVFEKIRQYDESFLSEIVLNYDLLETDDEFDINSLAEIVFTSGSTGEPKGVMLSHKNIIANTNSIISYLNLTSNDVMCVVLPFHYCYGLSLLHTHLRVGASIVINNTFVFIGSVLKDLNDFNCTGFAGVPSHFQILLKKTNIFNSPESLSLRYLTQAGGKLHNSFIEQICTAIPDKDFFVMYGQTEATARLAYLDPTMVLKKLGSIGKHIPGVDLKVVDYLGNEVDAGVEGELIARGENIMLGYYDDENSTKEVIKNNWLYTGDYAKKDEEGYIYIVARKKEILKVRGKRVSPKEIEGVIMSLEEVIDCTVVGFEDDVTGEGIEATIVIREIEEKEVVAEKVLNICKGNLSTYKIPSRFIFKDQMKLKTSGKK